MRIDLFQAGIYTLGFVLLPTANAIGQCEYEIKSAVMTDIQWTNCGTHGCWETVLTNPTTVLVSGVHMGGGLSRINVNSAGYNLLGATLTVNEPVVTSGPRPNLAPPIQPVKFTIGAEVGVNQPFEATGTYQQLPYKSVVAPGSTRLAPWNPPWVSKYTNIWEKIFVGATVFRREECSRVSPPGEYVIDIPFVVSDAQWQWADSNHGRWTLASDFRGVYRINATVVSTLELAVAPTSLDCGRIPVGKNTVTPCPITRASINGAPPDLNSVKFLVSAEGDLNLVAHPGDGTYIPLTPTGSYDLIRADGSLHINVAPNAQGSAGTRTARVNITAEHK